MMFRLAEKYLIQFCKSGAKSDIFSDLRAEVYTHSGKSLGELPPSSSSIAGHLRRCHYVVRMSLDFLRGDNEMMNPLMYGWEEIDSTFSAEKCYLPLPDEYIVTCGCKSGKCRGRCTCRKMDASCTEHCRCDRKCDDYISPEATAILLH